MRDKTSYPVLGALLLSLCLGSFANLAADPVQSPAQVTEPVPPLPAPPAPPAPPLVEPPAPPPAPSPEFVLTPIDNVPIDSTYTRVAVPAGRKVLIAAQGTVVTGTKQTAWRIYPPNPDATLEQDTRVVSFVADAPGRYWLVSAITGEDTAAAPLMRTILVEVGNVPPTPTPPGPVPPDPKPPVPDVDPAPVAKEGFRALLIYDSVAGLPPVFASTEVRALLNTYTVKGDDNKTPDWRCWDTTVDPVGDFDVWADYRKVVPADAKFYVVLGDGKRGYAGPPPNTIAEMKALILKYATGK